MGKKSKMDTKDSKGVNNFGEFVPSFNAWMTPDALKERAREVAKSTENKEKK